MNPSLSLNLKIACFTIFTIQTAQSAQEPFDPNDTDSGHKYNFNTEQFTLGCCFLKIVDSKEWIQRAGDYRGAQYGITDARTKCYCKRTSRCCTCCQENLKSERYEPVIAFIPDSQTGTPTIACLSQCYPQETIDSASNDSASNSTQVQIGSIIIISPNTAFDPSSSEKKKSHVITERIPFSAITDRIS